MEPVSTWISVGIAFVLGVITALFKTFSLMTRISVLEQRINKVEVDILRLEDRVVSKLESIDKKLDSFILDIYSKNAD